ncbi:MAG: AAA family ATPase [Pseudonocardiaceae bacterium]
MEEPRHRGLHLAVVSDAVADQLGVSGTLATAPVHVRVVNPHTGEQGFARLHASDQVTSSRVITQNYILRNAGLQEGDEADIHIWDPLARAVPAESLTLNEVGIGLGDADGSGLARNARQRLADSGLTVVIGHRFSLPLSGREVMFEVVSTVPAEAPVRCADDTDLTIVNHSAGSQVGSTTRPPRDGAVFEDIGGLEGPIRRIAELVVWPVEYPELFERLGIGTARGIILHGPPGNGKTLLARSVARRLGAHFFSINGPEILSKFYGESEQRLRKVFEDAAREQPSVVFIDELDSIAPSRDSVSGDLEVRLVSQLLTLMDGLTDRGQIIVIGATNRPSAVDQALRRPGRFDHEVEIGPPDQDARRAILDVHTRAIPLAHDVDLEAIADLTVGYVGADLASLCQEAAMATARRTLAARGADVTMVDVGQVDFFEGIRHVQPSAFREQRQPPAGLDWEHLIGMNDTKRALIELIDWPMSKRSDLKRLGIDQGGGILLTGPPLSGKTTIITALAKRLVASLIYLPSVDLLSPWVGESERLIRQAFIRARHASPSIVFIDNFEQLEVTGSDLARRVLAQVSNELIQLRIATPAFVVVASRDDRAAGDPLFSDVVGVDEPAEADVRVMLEGRLSPYLGTDAAVGEFASRMDGLAIGQVARFCNEALTCALWENSEKVVVQSRHLSAALVRVDRKRYLDRER